MSAYDLAHLYFTEYRKSDFPATEENKRKVLRRINELLDSGWTDVDIIHHWKTGEGEPAGGNLLRSDEFYWHNQLRIMPGPARVEFDLDSGAMKRIQEPWFLEMRASYTVDDLLDYYLKQFGLTRSQVNVNKYLGTFRYLLGRYHVDLLLFMIDACANHRKDADEGPPLDPIVVGEYEPFGRQAMERKITENRLAGGDRVEPRRRVPVG